MTDIADARSEIDAIDTAILDLLQKRNSAVVRIAENKYRNGIPVKNLERESIHLHDLRAVLLHVHDVVLREESASRRIEVLNFLYRITRYRELSGGS